MILSFRMAAHFTKTESLAEQVNEVRVINKIDRINLFFIMRMQTMKKPKLIVSSYTRIGYGIIKKSP